MDKKTRKHTKSVDDWSFELLFRKHYVSLCCFANKFLANMDEAEEVVQEVFLKVWEKKDRLQLDDQMRPYLFKSVQNLCFNFIEHRKVEDNYYAVIELIYRSQTDNYSAYESVLYSEFQEKAGRAINDLPDECRKIFLLSRDEGLKYAEIAARLGISVKTVETQISRALSRLRTELKDYLLLLLVTFFLNN